ncbi:hypothetical protein TIFTF001_018770 [Ficus carica]|uniref:Uncharacterized protein n=1 Tax=Ficus carica TaxID=3494 RepID=A0AA88D892_FICCA|nr:hypothetical protein TIFTF001_018770 [Ficus carica]
MVSSDHSSSSQAGSLSALMYWMRFTHTILKVFSLVLVLDLRNSFVFNLEKEVLPQKSLDLAYIAWMRTDQAIMAWLLVSIQRSKSKVMQFAVPAYMRSG